MRVRHIVLIMLVLLSVVTYMDRICISVSAKAMKEDLGINDETWGLVMGAFYLSYGLFEIPTGAWGDRYGQRRTLTRIVIWWSGFTMLTGQAVGFRSLFLTRFLFGAGEAGAYPNAAGSIGHWFPAHERARAQGAVWAASRLGGAVTPILVVPLIAWIGWRNTFFMFGAVGLVWAAGWQWWYRDRPSEKSSVTSLELAEIGAPAPTEHASVPWGKLFRQPQLWLIMGMYFTYAWGPVFYMTWLPQYLTKGRGFTEQQMSVFTAIPFLMGTFGNLAGGFLSDHLTRKMGPRIGRLLVGSSCLAVSAFCLLFTAMVANKFVAAGLLAIGFGIIDGMLPCAWAICLDIGRRHAGAVSGAMNMAGQAGGFLGTYLFGVLITRNGNYNQPLFVIASMVLISAVLFALINPSRKLLDESEGAEGK